MHIFIQIWNDVRHFWDAIPPIIQYPLVFYFQYIYLRRKLAAQIEQTVDAERNRLKTMTTGYIKRVWPNSVRYAAIWKHYWHHDQVKYVDCFKDTCSTP